MTFRGRYPDYNSAMFPNFEHPYIKARNIFKSFLFFFTTLWDFTLSLWSWKQTRNIRCLWLSACGGDNSIAHINFMYVQSVCSRVIMIWRSKREREKKKVILHSINSSQETVHLNKGTKFIETKKKNQSTIYLSLTSKLSVRKTSLFIIIRLFFVKISMYSRISVEKNWLHVTFSITNY